MASTLAKPPIHHRQSSKSASTSSSIVTIQRPSSRNGARAAGPAVRSPSPIAALQSNRTISPDTRKRLSTNQSRPSSGINEGIGNLNRWSHSTTSSKSSATHNRRNSFARRLSGSLGSFGGGFNSSQSPPKQKFIISKSSPAHSPNNVTPLPPSLSLADRLPAVITLPSLSQAVDAASNTPISEAVTPSVVDLLTPSTHTPGQGDYFGDVGNAEASPKQNSRMHYPTATTTPEVPFAFRSGKREGPGSPPVHSAPSTVRSQQIEPTLSQRTRSHAEQTAKSGHSRSREGGKGSGGTEGESSASSIRSARKDVRRRKAPSQKAMLSKALQKANHAVLLDNAQNFEGAISAYTEACNLLQQVMLRSAGEDDRKKLEAIRNTYRSRIVELETTDAQSPETESKALPQRPTSEESRDQEPFSPVTDEEEDGAIIETATATRVGYDSNHIAAQKRPSTLTRDQLPPRRQSLLPFAFDDGSQPSRSPIREYTAPRPVQGTSHVTQGYVRGTPSAALAAENDNTPPLSRNDVSPLPLDESGVGIVSSDTTLQNSDPQSERLQIYRYETVESTSWLDTIDESGDDSSQSVHSRRSSIGLRRKHIRAPSGATEAEFDAALDAAVEAAYDDGFEPAQDSVAAMSPEQSIYMSKGDSISNARRNVELAKQKVREAEREATIAMATNRTIPRPQNKPESRDRSDSIELEYGDEEAEEEERILEEMTKDYVMDDTEFDVRSKSALPRQSDSSGFSGRTWGSSIGSNPTTGGTSLSTVAELTILPELPSEDVPKPVPPPPPNPPPTAALPPPPQIASGSGPGAPPRAPPPRPPSLGISPSPSVRERRLSGHKFTHLKIETNAKVPPGMSAPRTQPPVIPPPALSAEALVEPPKSAIMIRESLQTLPSHGLEPASLLIPPSAGSQLPSSQASPSAIDTKANASPATPALTKATSTDSEESTLPLSNSPVRVKKSSVLPGGLRKNFSSSSLKGRQISVSTPNASDDSPSTPLTTAFSRTSHPNGSLPELPATKILTDPMPSVPFAGINFFDHDIKSPVSPTTPNTASQLAPSPLEPCPESFLLRPFWVMRCVFNTIAHPRGGYISSGLFVPRDIWRVKNVKVKNIEEKISNCDLLTAALLKLATVDTLDADAVLEEMQAFENVLDQVQNILSKKLGAEVGVHGSVAMFKGSGVIDEAGLPNEVLTSKIPNTNSKSYLSTWRKLRSKNSSAPGLPINVGATNGKEGSRDTLMMRSLPMTNMNNPKLPKRDVSKVQCIGPNANYMGSLARLCDAVQVLDQIARQVEDPGLRHSSQTHVGLELSTRHAAEFFGFYVVRFILTDLGMMLDKFIKRGSEWVLA